MTATTHCNKCNDVIVLLAEENSYICDMPHNGKFYGAEFCHKCAEKLIKEYGFEEE